MELFPSTDCRTVRNSAEFKYVEALGRIFTI